MLDKVLPVVSKPAKRKMTDWAVISSSLSLLTPSILTWYEIVKKGLSTV